MNKGLMVGGTVAVLVLVAIAGGVWYMNNGTKSQDSATREDAVPSETSNDKKMAPNPTEVVAEDPGTGNVVTLEVTNSGLKFMPNQLKVKKGDTVRVTYKNAGGIHDFVIDEFAVATNQIGDGEEEEVEFVASKTGSFEFYCSVGNHRAMGMVGTLVVE